MVLGNNKLEFTVNWYLIKGTIQQPCYEQGEPPPPSTVPTSRKSFQIALLSKIYQQLQLCCSKTLFQFARQNSPSIVFAFNILSAVPNFQNILQIALDFTIYRHCFQNFISSYNFVVPKHCFKICVRIHHLSSLLSPFYKQFQTSKTSFKQRQNSPSIIFAFKILSAVPTSKISFKQRQDLPSILLAFKILSAVPTSKTQFQIASEFTIYSVLAFIFVLAVPTSKTLF